MYIAWPLHKDGFAAVLTHHEQVWHHSKALHAEERLCKSEAYPIQFNAGKCNVTQTLIRQIYGRGANRCAQHPANLQPKDRLFVASCKWLWKQRNRFCTDPLTCSLSRYQFSNNQPTESPIESAESVVLVGMQSTVLSPHLQLTEAGFFLRMLILVVSFTGLHLYTHLSHHVGMKKYSLLLQDLTTCIFTHCKRFIAAVRAKIVN